MLEVTRITKIHEEHIRIQKIQHEAFVAAAEAAHKAQEEERKRREEAQIAYHEAQMKERRSDFEKNFRNVWATGNTGVSWMQMTVQSRSDAEAIIGKLFQKTLIADVQDINHVYQRVYTTVEGKVLTTDENQHKLIMLTSDDRVAEAIEEVGVYYSDNAHMQKYPKFDLIVTPLVTGSKEYIEWVKLQTQVKDGEELDFYEEEVPEEMEANTNKANVPALGEEESGSDDGEAEE